MCLSTLLSNTTRNGVVLAAQRQTVQKTYYSLFLLTVCRSSPLTKYTVFHEVYHITHQLIWNVSYSNSNISVKLVLKSLEKICAIMSILIDHLPLNSNIWNWYTFSGHRCHCLVSTDSVCCGVVLNGAWYAYELYRSRIWILVDILNGNIIKPPYAWSHTDSPKLGNQIGCLSLAMKVQSNGGR